MKKRIALAVAVAGLVLGSTFAPALIDSAEAKGSHRGQVTDSTASATQFDESVESLSITWY